MTEPVPPLKGPKIVMRFYDLILDLHELQHRLAAMKARSVKGTTGTQASFLKLFDGDHQKVRELERRDLGHRGGRPAHPAPGNPARPLAHHPALPGERPRSSPVVRACRVGRPARWRPARRGHSAPRAGCTSGSPRRCWSASLPRVSDPPQYDSPGWRAITSVRPPSWVSASSSSWGVPVRIGKVCQ